MKEKIYLENSDLKIVQSILKQYLPDQEVWAFGSRITPKHKKFSDLDLVIITTKPLSIEILSNIADAFSQSDLSIKVDILDWSRITNAFQKIILNHYIKMQ